MGVIHAINDPVRTLLLPVDESAVEKLNQRVEESRGVFADLAALEVQFQGNLGDAARLRF